MNTSECIQTAALGTLKDPSASEVGYRTVLRQNIYDGAPEITFSVDATTVDALGYALLNHEASPKDRQDAAAQAVSGIRDHVLGCASILGVLDGKDVEERSNGLSAAITQQTAELAATYPATGGTDVLVGALSDVVDMAKSDSNADKAVVACVALEIIRPYMARRLAELDVYDDTALSEQITKLQSDAALMQKLCGSVSKAIEFLLKGDSDISTDEIAERLFTMGPIFVKMGQSLTGIAKKSPGPRAPFVMQIGRSLQEGIALPQEDQQAELEAMLPPELSFDRVISSASIAYILGVHDRAGNTFAAKVRRPHIERALHDNVRAYTVASDVITEYLTAHAGDSALTGELARMQTILPFLLEVIRHDIEGEFDFDREKSMQARAHQALADMSAIHVPTVHQELSDADHIVMDVVPGVRIEDAPAHPDRLKNLATMATRLWKKGLIHGDMHAGNVKAMPNGNGDIVVYDWGRTIEREPRMMRNMGSFLIALARKKPEAIAKAYVAIQSPDHEQMSIDDATIVASDTIQAVRDQQSLRKRNRAQKAIFETNAIMQSFLITAGIRHQSAMHGDYLALMKSSAALGTIVQDELAKPYYQKRGRKAVALLKSFAAGAAEVIAR